MSDNYTRDQVKISLAKILQTLGWNSINTTPLEILTDILETYMTQLTRNTTSYANEFGCTQPNLDHLGLTFRDMGINVGELEEYVKYVNFGPPPTPVPKYPIPKEDHLNFLKPGSKEVITRPVHIHEHLPPMNPLLEESEPSAVENTICKVEELEDGNLENSEVFKKPADIMPPEFKRPSFRREEEGCRPTRELSSIMMTSGGFLSPSREGKLPESRSPVPPDPTKPDLTKPEVETIDLNKKPTKTVKKVEKRKARPKVSNDPNAPPAKRKTSSMKWVLKSKEAKLFGNAPKPTTDLTKINPVPNKVNQAAKVNKALAAARLKTEKLNTTITPITIKPIAATQPVLQEHDNVDKLFTEPDKKKVNIFKKISNVKNEKIEVKGGKSELRQESRESSPDLIIDEPDEIVSKLSHLPSDVTIEPINPVPMKSPEKVEPSYFDDDSQPGTPSTPKTPEMISHSPPMVKEKRKRKDSRKPRKVSKHQSPHRLDNDVIDIDMERPKTPEAQGLTKLDMSIVSMAQIPPHSSSMQTFPFIPNFGGPGLIPTHLPNNSLFSHLTFPPINLSHFGQKPYMPPMNQSFPMTSNSNFVQNPFAVTKTDEQLVKVEKLSPNVPEAETSASLKPDKKSKEHKKDKKDKLKKRNKKDKIKNKAEKKKLKEEKKVKIKKEKKEKRKDKEQQQQLQQQVKEPDTPPNVKITLKIKSPSPRPETPETRKLNIKPIVKKDEEEPVVEPEERTRETSPGLAKISALVCGPPKPKIVIPPVIPPPAEETVHEENSIATAPRTGPGPGRPRIHPIKPKPSKPKKRRTPIKKDAEGNEVWICPACGKQDDGSPMIGCDGCDAWYHWVCVGIQVPPDDREDWYCRHCLLKKNEDLQSDKQKKKRKKREKKEH